jgi:hypothetical protein
MKLLLKRHPPSGTNLTTAQEEAFPAPDQVDVGELVINTITGKLYTKLDNGNIVEFVSQKICFDPAPDISFFYESKLVTAPDYLINNFCCAGGLLTVVVNKLKLEPATYGFNLVELTNNTISDNLSIGQPAYVAYSETENGETIQYRKATIPITLSFSSLNYNNISLFQFKITDSLNKIIRGSERIVTIKCLESNQS